VSGRRPLAGIAAAVVVVALVLGFGIAYVAGANDGATPPARTETHGFSATPDRVSAPAPVRVPAAVALPSLPGLTAPPASAPSRPSAGAPASPALGSGGSGSGGGGSGGGGSAPKPPPSSGGEVG
jgi:hypothetical protein